MTPRVPVKSLDEGMKVIGWMSYHQAYLRGVIRKIVLDGCVIKGDNLEEWVPHFLVFPDTPETLTEILLEGDKLYHATDNLRRYETRYDGVSQRR